MQVWHRLCAFLVFALPATSNALAEEGTPLSQLIFSNTGVVRSDMRFEEKTQPCFYVETPAAWTCLWGQPSGGAGYPYLYRVDSRDGESRLVPPPPGVRSAAPLGGLGAGTIELRADGSLRDWNIFNNSPGGGGEKVQLDDALFGLRIKTADESPRVWALRTHPPKGLPSVAQIEYGGAFPVSRLRFRDPSLPLAVDLYAYSEFVMRDAAASATPAIVFSFELSNPLPKPLEAAILFSLPNHIEGKVSAADGLRLSRDGNGPVSGAMLLRFGGKEPVSCGVGDDLAAIWNVFSETGGAGTQSVNVAGKQVAISTRLTLPSGETKTVHLVMAWRFPNRTHNHDRERVGNYYTKLYPSVEDVAEKVLARLPKTWASLLEWQHACFDNSLPDWLQDSMINSVATMAKTGMWLEDGRWRQWESFSCFAVDPVHIHFYRSLPYMLFFPELQRSEFRGFASIQEPNGFINENLGDAEHAMDHPSGRNMGDCTSVFVLGVYGQYLWTGDRQYLDELWPHVKKAAQWQIERSRRFGLPERLNNTYDWWDFEQKDVVCYNAVLHLAAMEAAARLARIEADEPFAQACQTYLQSAKQSLDKLLWTGQYYRAWWMQAGGYPDALHADSLYGQLWCSILGLGQVVDAEKARAHLAAESRFNATPFGLKVMQHRGKDMIDDLVWQAGSLDWAALNLYLDGDTHASLDEARKLIDAWRVGLADSWDWRDLSRGDDGQPWCNSHYARQLMLWSIPLALSGQQYSATERKLSFAPRSGAPERLPWFIPAANGVLERLPDGKRRLSVLSGKLELDELRVADGARAKNVMLETGHSLDLGSAK